MPDHPVPMEPLAAALRKRYQLERAIGSGGMGTVYVARDLKLERRVAIKVLRPEVATAIGTERFLREVALTARLEHPHIVPLHDSGTADGFLYYVMPFVEGQSLRERITGGAAIPTTEVLQILRDVLDALSYAHELGIVHRDIKPDNVLLRRRHALVTDFGIAKAISASSGPAASLTGPGSLVGTPAYMAPEQAAGERVDARTDLYAVGVMTYEMLSGALPFEAEGVQEMLVKHLTVQPTPLIERRPELPPRLAVMIMRCLEKRPQDRWQDATELLATLQDRPALLRRSAAGLTSREGVLTVGVDESPTPPYRFGQPGDGTFRGFEIDLLRAVADRLELRLECRATEWEQAVAALQDGQMDLLCRGVSITPERRRILQFSIPYLDTALAMAIPTDSPLTGFEDLSGRTVGVRRSTLAEEFITGRGLTNAVRTFRSSTEPYEALRGGALDAVVDHLPIARFVARSFPELRVVGPLKGTHLALGFGFAGRNESLRRVVDALLTELKEDGTWLRSARRWLQT